MSKISEAKALELVLIFTAKDKWYEIKDLPFTTKQVIQLMAQAIDVERTKLKTKVNRHFEDE
tara:strand:- start:64 stop:249 length:186 start_codon:yes stop_codon:yes gene_type:complete